EIGRGGERHHRRQGALRAAETQRREAYEEDSEKAAKHRIEPGRDLGFAEGLEGGGARPVLERRLLEVLGAVEARRHPVARGGHLARDLRVAALVGVGERAIGVVDVDRDRGDAEEQQRDASRAVSHASRRTTTAPEPPCTWRGST